MLPLNISLVSESGVGANLIKGLAQEVFLDYQALLLNYTYAVYNLSVGSTVVLHYDTTPNSINSIPPAIGLLQKHFNMTEDDSRELHSPKSYIGIKHTKRKLDIGAVKDLLRTILTSNHLAIVTESGRIASTLVKL